MRTLGAKLVITLVAFAGSIISGVGSESNYVAVIESFYSSRDSVKLYAYKQHLTDKIKTNSNEFTEVEKVAQDESVRPSSLAFFDLVNVVEAADRERFLIFASNTIVSRLADVSAKTTILNKIHAGWVSGGQSLDLKSKELFRLAANDDNRLVKVHACRLLVGYNVNGQSVPGVDPSLGKVLLLAALRDGFKRESFIDREPFAFILASADSKYSEFYSQNIRVLILEDETRSAATRKSYAERLRSLGLLSDEEVKKY